MSKRKPPVSKMGMMLIDEAELCCIILEGITERRRPEGMSAKEALDGAHLDPELRGMLHDTATRVVDYFVSCMNKGGIETEDARYAPGGRLDA